MWCVTNRKPILLVRYRNGTLSPACPRTLLVFQGKEGKETWNLLVSYHSSACQTGEPLSWSKNLPSSCCHSFKTKTIKHGIARPYHVPFLDKLAVLRYAVSWYQGKSWCCSYSVWMCASGPGRFGRAELHLANSCKVNAALQTRFVNGFSELLHLSHYW